MTKKFKQSHVSFYMFVNIFFNILGFSKLCNQEAVHSFLACVLQEGVEGKEEIQPTVSLKQ